MDIKKIIAENGSYNFPIGLGGCQISDLHFDSCVYDLVAFDEKLKPTKIIKYEDEFAIMHHYLKLYPKTFSI